ncbi:MAG: UDP-glucose 4-epimerase GalE [Alphaproteobacteria bacterium]|nr:UDP-glucose 4-epimerase GalE [Alphaproteobacteria bacterium]
MILVTGATGFIASHTIVELQNAGYDIVGVDNLCNSDIETLKNIEKITGKKIEFCNVDIRDGNKLKEFLSKYKIDCCIHFAGLKAVGESVSKPVEYYDNNIGGTISLLKVLREIGCKNLIFSSSATVYGTPAFMPITEDCPKGICTNPYGWTKHMIEQILIDVQNANKDMNIVILRYFNPIGAHPSGMIGEKPNGIPNNLMPYITQVACGKREKLFVYGDDYDTPDGTGVRDYIHVVDLARGHVCAMRAIDKNCGLDIFNLGTGHGYSVLDVIKTFEHENNIKIPYEIVARRPGDIAMCYADPAKAKSVLGWIAQYSLQDMCRDSWNYQKNML